LYTRVLLSDKWINNNNNNNNNNNDSQDTIYSAIICGAKPYAKVHFASSGMKIGQRQVAANS